MRLNHRLFLTFYTFAICAIFDAHAVAPFSQYGQIQNVQSYSSNPFWTPDAPYNQRMPTPVYSMGTDLKTSDCQRVTTNLVAAQCATLNNCADATLADIRPALILQMSRMPGGNYATACAGYLDTAFADYKKKNSHIVANVNNATFPTATTPNPNIQNNTNPQNIFAPKTPEWAADVQQREQELQDLKAASGYTPPQLENAEFPTTYADLSFSARMENEAAGYEPFKDKSAYRTLEIKEETRPAPPTTTTTTTSTQSPAVSAAPAQSPAASAAPAQSPDTPEKPKESGPIVLKLYTE